MTSAVHQYPKDMDWALNGFMVPHAAVRLGLTRFEAAARAVQAAPSAGKLKSLKEWYTNYFYEFVHHHHDIEEKDYFPWIQSKLPAGRSLKPEHSHEHKDLLQSLDDFKVAFEKLEGLASDGVMSASFSDEMAKLTKSVTAFCKDMTEHIDAEEEHIPPVMHELLDKAQVDAKETEIVQALGLGGAALMLPWIIEAMTLYDPTPEKKFMNNFYNNIPPPLRFFMWMSWMGAYEKNNKEVIESLVTGEPRKRMACC